MTQKFTAQVIPYSSVVGTGVMVLDDWGPCVAMISIRPMSADLSEQQQKDLANLIAGEINRLALHEGDNDDE